MLAIVSWLQPCNYLVGAEHLLTLQEILLAFLIKSGKYDHSELQFILQQQCSHNAPYSNSMQFGNTILGLRAELSPKGWTDAKSTFLVLNVR